MYISEKKNKWKTEIKYMRKKRKRSTGIINCNWKAVHNCFGESRHITSNHLHPRSGAFSLKLPKFSIRVTQWHIMSSKHKNLQIIRQNKNGLNPSIGNERLSIELYEPNFIFYLLMINTVPISCTSPLGATLSKFSNPVYTRTWSEAETQAPANHLKQEERTSTYFLCNSE